MRDSKNMTLPAKLPRRHILICNERIIFRFGVDRILIELARRFVSLGWTVTFVAMRCDRDVLSAICDDIHVVSSPHGVDLYGQEAVCEAYLDEHWDEITRNHPVDAMIVGGWPFFFVGRLGKRRSIPTAFIDAGAVPHDGLDTNRTSIQRAVRRVRASALPHFDRIWPISRFIRDTQTLPDRAHGEGVEVITLGVDHLAANVFSHNAGEGGALNGEQFAEIQNAVRRATPLIFNLGRFETEGYKNSKASFAVIRGLVARARDLDQEPPKLIILANEAEAAIPADLAPHVICVDSPDDSTMIQLMQVANVGFSPSVWEGFNLPIGEMTILGKPVVAYNIGAHPEVVLHPWFLANGDAEAIDKIDAVLRGRMPDRVMTAGLLAAYAAKFGWRSSLDHYQRAVEKLCEHSNFAKITKILLVDVSNASIDTANSGVIRVTRRLTRELQNYDDQLVLPVWWDAKAREYRLINGDRHSLLASYSGPTTGMSHVIATGTELSLEQILHQLGSSKSMELTLFMPEVNMSGEAENCLHWATQRGARTIAILYDLIPINHPNYCSETLLKQFPVYLHALAQVDQVVAISGNSLEDFKEYLAKRNLPSPRRMDLIWLPGQLGSIERTTTAPKTSADGPLSIVCLCTIEPRKNHRSLIAGYTRFRERHPDVDCRLVLIGNAYHGADDLLLYVREAEAADESIKWRGPLGDADVVEAMNSAAFTVYPSLVEGFGLPILESLWVATPCLCHNDGVMAEIAAGGGCLMVDMADPDAIADGLALMACDASMRATLARQATDRTIMDWKGYARHFKMLLDNDGDQSGVTSGQPLLRAPVMDDAFFATVPIVAERMSHRLSGMSQIVDSPALLATGGSDYALQVKPPTDAASSIPSSRAPAGAAASSGSGLVVPSNRANGRDQKNRHIGGWLRRYKAKRAEKLKFERILATGMFDEDWYLKRYPDVRADGILPIRHFVRHGIAENRLPGPNFDPEAFLRDCPEAAESPLPPFEQFLQSVSSRR